MARQVDHVAWLATSSDLVCRLADAETGRTTVEIIDAEQGTRRWLAVGGTPRPAPDGQQIAYVAEDDDGKPQI